MRRPSGHALLLGIIALLLLGCSARAARASEDIVRDLNDCSRQLDPELDVGFARIAERCPQLVHSLNASRYAPWLPSGWNEDGNELSAGSLAELATLIERELHPDVLRAPPPLAQLQGVLAQLGPQASGRGGLWERFKGWLRSIFQADDKPGESWLARLLRRVDISEAVWRVIGYGALAIVLLLAALIVVNELRVAGLLARRGVAERRGVGPGVLSHRRGTLRELEYSDPRERPALLLQLILEALMRGGRLPPAGALTVRELAHSARLEPQDGTRLELLGAVAEHARYASAPPADVELEQSLARGRELLATLERRGAAPA
ncbi:MAG TPA: hypothetical protein VF315_00420 [Steroidobacteraceae bacterium]